MLVKSPRNAHCLRIDRFGFGEAGQARVVRLLWLDGWKVYTRKRGSDEYSGSSIGHFPMQPLKKGKRPWKGR
jgi:hypothetical protein